MGGPRYPRWVIDKAREMRKGCESYKFIAHTLHVSEGGLAPHISDIKPVCSHRDQPDGAERGGQPVPAPQDDSKPVEVCRLYPPQAKKLNFVVQTEVRSLEELAEVKRMLSEHIERDQRAEARKPVEACPLSTISKEPEVRVAPPPERPRQYAPLSPFANRMNRLMMLSLATGVPLRDIPLWMWLSIR